MKRRTMVLVGSGLTLLLGLAGCGRAPDSVADRMQVLALVDGHRITVGDVRDYLYIRPGSRGAYTSVDAVKGLVEELVIAELLYQEAERSGLQDDPAVQRAVRQLLVQRLLEERVEQPVVTRAITDAELRDYFERHRSAYTWPEQVRLADLFVAVAEDASASVRAAKRRQAESLLAQAHEAVRARRGLGELIRARSDKHPAYALGDTGYFDRQGAPIGLDAALVQAAFSLARNGELFERVVETPLGFHVIMRVGHRSANEVTYEQVADTLRQRMLRDELAAKREELIAGLRERGSVRLDQQALTAFAAELQQQALSAQASMSEGSQVSGSPPAIPQAQR